MVLQYCVMSLVTMRPPAGLTWNFLKCSSNWLRMPVAISVEQRVRFGPPSMDWDRASPTLARNVHVARQVFFFFGNINKS